LELAVFIKLNVTASTITLLKDMYHLIIERKN